jgi:phosphatidyl-myo-inositol dimannoside synthase
MNKKIHVWTPGIAPGSGGIQVFSRDLIRALATAYQKHSITVFSKNDKQSHPIDFQDIEHQPIKYYYYERKKNFMHSVRFAIGLFFRAIIDRPALIITTHVNFTPIAAVLKKLIGVKYICIAHGVDVWGLRKPSTLKGIHQADLCLAVSNFTRNSLINELRVKPEQTVVFHNTFDAERFSLRPKPTDLLARYGINQEQPVLLTVTRLAGEERYKGYESVLRVLPNLIKIHPRLHYFLVGTGNDTQRIKNMIEELKLNDFVTMTGFVPDSELPYFYNLCDIFVMPSRREGFGIVFLEALGSGKPTIAGNQDGSSDPLINGSLGVLINPENLQELQNSIENIIEKKAMPEIIYNPIQLRTRAIEEFGHARFKQNLKSILDTLI